jgi:hypothetical protein
MKLTGNIDLSLKDEIDWGILIYSPKMILTEEY